MSSIDLSDVYQFDGGLLSLSLGGSTTTLLSDLSAQSPAVVVDANDSFEQTDDGVTTFNGDTIDYVGNGTASLLGFLDPQDFVMFNASGSTYLWFPNGTPVGAGLSFTLDLDDAGAYAYCFAADTLIAGPDGERKVQDLSIGDTILTADGKETAVKWIGRQTLNKMFGEASKQMVRISAGALGSGLPHSDLTLTADHGLSLDGYLVNASALVNGTTVSFVPTSELEMQFTVYHIETEGHQEILANGAAAETFIDYSERKKFDNYDEFVELIGAEHVIAEMDKPRVSARRMLPPELKARLDLDYADVELSACA